ncbi:unnamed protein product [Durusdinium trenchii]|uniref:Uncharacterized protein n=1 Tax=Durusdinium trenchii TaxID=1381693 RepID=A0ABP0LLW4_9DINO
MLKDMTGGHSGLCSEDSLARAGRSSETQTRWTGQIAFASPFYGRDTLKVAASHSIAHNLFCAALAKKLSIPLANSELRRCSQRAQRPKRPEPSSSTFSFSSWLFRRGAFLLLGGFCGTTFVWSVAPTSFQAIMAWLSFLMFSNFT